MRESLCEVQVLKIDTAGEKGSDGGEPEVEEKAVKNVTQETVSKRTNSLFPHLQW